MRGDFGYEEEVKPKGGYDWAMLKRLYPFSRPYQGLILCVISVVVCITLLDLALPYVTKIAIDRYIVPATGFGSQSDSQAEDDEAKAVRTYQVDMTNASNAAIVAKYPNLFERHGTHARIAFESLSKLSREDRMVLRQSDLAGVALVALVFIALVLANFVLNFIQTLIMEYTGHRIMHDLRISLFDHIQHLSISYFSKNPVGRLVTRVTNDIQNMHELFTSVIAFLFKDVFLLVGIAAVLISIDWQLALVSFLVLPFVWRAALRFAGKAREVFRILRIKLAEINTQFSETIGGIKVIQLYRHELENDRRFRKLNHENYEAGMAQIHLFALFMPIIELLGVAAVGMVIFYGGSRVLSRQISLGDMVAFISYIRMFFRPIRDIAEKYNVLQNALASAERIFLVLDSKDQLPPPRRPVPVKSSGHQVDSDRFERMDFDRVDFSYLPDVPVLKAVSFTLSAGESVGIVGPTGSGKTSMINLITRFYDPSGGQVRLNGKDLRELSPEDYLSQMALVMQDPFLFSGTIRDNILKGSNMTASDDLSGILSASNCTGLVARAPKGLDTELSEAGTSISSGERQLISIARAFARNPQLIILDEATSYIDSQTEQKIQEALFNLMKNRTAIVVAHRLATVRQLDRILVLNRGRIIESGNHARLMDSKGFYYRLHQFQN